MKYLSRETSKFAMAFVALLVAYMTGFCVVKFRGDAVPAPTHNLWWLTSSLILVSWVQADRRVRRLPVPFEFDVLVFFAWPVVVPYYLCRTRGWRGLLPVLGMVGIIAAFAFAEAFARVFLGKR